MDISSPNAKSDQAVSSTIRGVKANKRLRSMWIIFFCEIVLLTWFIFRDPFLSYRILAPFRPAHKMIPIPGEDPFKRDILLGTLLPKNEIGNAIRKTAVKSMRGYLLVPVGDCASCIKADLVGWKSQCDELGISFIMVTTANNDAARKFCKRLRLSAPFVSDPKGVMNEDLNAVWYGRPYLFSSDWKLLWYQPHLGPDNPFADKGFLAVLKDVKK